MEVSTLIGEHTAALHAFIYRMCGSADVADELTQETFVRALGASGTYSPRARVRTWLFHIAANLVRDRWRQQARRGDAVPLDDLNLIAPESTEDAALAGVGYLEVRAALLQLSLEQRATLILRYYHDLGYEEIARALSCPVGTVRSRIHNGLARLERMLTKEVETDETG